MSDAIIARRGSKGSFPEGVFKVLHTEIISTNNNFTVPKSIKVECGDRMVTKISSKFNFYLSDLEIITLSIDSESMKPMSILDINISREE